MRLTTPTFKLIGISGLFISYLTGMNASTLYSTGFETPTFNTGQLAGQNGWTDDGNASHITVENTFVNTGSQAVQFSASGASGQTGVFLADNYVVPAASPVITMTVDYYRASGGTASERVDVSGFDQNANGLGLVRWDANNGLEIVSGNSDTVSNGLLSSNTWEAISIAYNFSNDTFSVYLNNNLVKANLPFYQGGATSTEFLEGGLFIQNPGTDLTYFDNYSVTASAPTPELATLYLLGPALVWVLFRVRHRIPKDRPAGPSDIPMRGPQVR
jgi:hypothetical protein